MIANDARAGVRIVVELDRLDLIDLVVSERRMGFDELLEDERHLVVQAQHLLWCAVLQDLFIKICTFLSNTGDVWFCWVNSTL